MKKIDRKNASVVQDDRKTQKAEKLWFVLVAQVRRHSRTLYLPLDSTVVRLHGVKKGDTIKYELLEITRAPEEDAPITAEGEL